MRGGGMKELRMDRQSEHGRGKAIVGRHHLQGMLYSTTQVSGKMAADAGGFRRRLKQSALP